MPIYDEKVSVTLENVLCEVLDLDTRIAYLLRIALTERYPQFNSRSRITDVQTAVIRIPEPGAFHPRRAPLEGWKGRFWRTVGELFAEQRWIDRGTKFIYDPIPGREIKLDAIGIQVPMSQFTDDPLNDYYGRFGYDPQSDTLFIRRQ